MAPAVIVSLHVATGAAIGSLAGSRAGAVLLAPVSHLAGDLVPHEDIRSTAFEAATGIAGLVLIARRHGALSPQALGAVAGSIPDVEHLLPWRLRGRKVFPTHRFPGWHKRGGVPAWLQLIVAGTLLWLVVRD